MFALFTGAALGAGFAGLLLLFVLARRAAAERYFVALTLALVLFEIFNAVSFAALFADNGDHQNFFAHVLGYLLVLIPPLGAWTAMPLLATARNRLALQLLALAAFALGVATQAQYHLLRVENFADHGFLFVLTVAGKIFFAGAIVANVLLLSKLEPILQAVEWRARRRSRMLRALILLVLLTLLAVCSLSLIYGRLDYGLWLICQILFGVLFIMLAVAMRHAPRPQVFMHAQALPLARLLSSNVLIYAGVYCLALGVLVKLTMLMGGSWHLFVSFFAALGAIVLTLVLLSGASWQERWTRFVDRHWRAPNYDFRSELHRLVERLAAATTPTEIACAIGAGLQEIFADAQCRLWLREEHGNTFALLYGHEPSSNTAVRESLTLSTKQIAWLERVGECFLPQQLLALEPVPAAAFANCALMTPLQVGTKLLGVIGLGQQQRGAAYRAEERQLFDVLANAASLAVHEAQLQQRVLVHEQTEAISRIAAFIAHDLRHAVSALGLLAHNAKAHLDKPEFRADFLASLQRVAREMHTLVQRLSAIKTGGEATQFVACEAAQLIREVVADAQIAPPHILEMQLEEMPRVWWDEEQIRIVLRNLLVNAREAMPHGGVLAVRAYCRAEHIHLTVADTGHGMTAEFMRERLFRPNQTTKAKGLGLGLYQSREIVRAHGGEILVESEEGRSTRFEVVLPCKQESRT